MSRCLKATFALMLWMFASWGAAQTLASARYPGLGRAATPKELAAWDIDVRPDFKGLPAGSGTVAKGQEVWEGKCALCHGVFGESTEVFSPLVGGTTADDMRTGHVASLTSGSFPGRTTLMKVATVSTLWDYINRAMPWNAPKSLSVDEVYSVTAYLLNLGGVLPDGFTLSDKNIAEVQVRMPNRNGMTRAHALWPGNEFGGKVKFDTQVVACMSNCQLDGQVTSFLPDYARNQHGNLAEQNRLVGPQRGADTSRAEMIGPGVGAMTVNLVAKPAVSVAESSKLLPKVDATAGVETTGADSKAVMKLLNQFSCTACHGISKKIVGPAFTDIAAKHAGKVDYLVAKIKSGGSGVWGAVPMPPQTVSEAQARAIASWLAAGASK